MMREILFRVKRLDNGKWVEGDICYHDNVVSYIGQHPAVGSMVIYDLDPLTVGQFTGLTDKNGKRGFGGDIVDRATERSGQKPSHRTGVVVCKRYGFVFEPIGNRGHGMWICGELEVIGNIHDKEET